MSTLSKLIVVDTTPLLALDACNQLDLLRSLFTSIIIPTDVQNDLAHGGSTSLPTGLTEEHLSWIEVRSLSSPPSAELLARLDRGEAAVITLALEIGSAIVCMDEKRGRRVAREAGLTVIGTVGVLLRAKRMGLIEEIKPSLDQMISKGIWLSDSLLKRALLEVAEHE